MSNVVQQRCLLIAPLSFYSFHHSVAAALKERGFSVDLMNEEFPANTLGKILGKCALPLLRYTTLSSLRRRLSNVDKYDLILIIKGRGLGVDSVNLLKDRASRIIGYNFDSFEYNPSAVDWYNVVDRYATFDVNDSQNYNLPLVHLFSSAPNIADSAERDFDLSIIQRVHSDRLKYAARMLDSLPRTSRIFIYLYQSSILLLILDMFRHPFLCLKLWKHIHLKPLPYIEAMRAIASSRVTFDFAHPRQSGITVRCFEAQSLGTAILTNNQSAIDSGLFEAGSIAYMPPDATHELIRASLINLSNAKPNIVTRALEDFLDDLLETAPQYE